MSLRINRWKLPPIDPGQIEKHLHTQIARITTKPIVPGHYNRSLGYTMASGDSQHRPGVEYLRPATKAARKARITLSKVW